MVAMMPAMPMLHMIMCHVQMIINDADGAKDGSDGDLRRQGIVIDPVLLEEAARIQQCVQDDADRRVRRILEDCLGSGHEAMHCLGMGQFYQEVMVSRLHLGQILSAEVLATELPQWFWILAGVGMEWVV